MKHTTLLDAAAYLFRTGYRYDVEMERFVRGSWHARVIVQKNGKCRILSS